MGTNNFFLLLPPSEGKAEGGNPHQPWSIESGAFGPQLAEQRSQLVAKLAQTKGGDGALLGVKGAHLVRAQEANISLLGAPTMPAWQRYTGVVWDHLDLLSLTPATRSSIVKRILVPSALLGLVRTDDLIPDYKLKMGARLAPFGVLNKWWRESVTSALQLTVKKRLVVDLLPQEHRATIDSDLVPSLVRIDLVSKAGGVVGGHNAKAAKGLLAKHLLITKGDDIRSMVASFKHPEYSAKVTS